jgi:hypothetical protein
MFKYAVKRPGALTGALRRCVRRLLVYRLPKSATVLLNEAKSGVRLLMENVDSLRVTVTLNDCAIGDANVVS